MIVVLRKNAAQNEKDRLIKWFESRGLTVHVSEGESRTVLGLIGDTFAIDPGLIAGLDIVESATRIGDVFRLTGRAARDGDTVVEIGNVKLGGGHFALIAGPCAVESEEQIVSAARAVKAAGADILRGGAFKPRTSPYDFPGLGKEALRLLRIAREETGMPVVSEIMSVRDLPLFEDVDVLQVGARSMQNFELLRELGRQDKPVLLKRSPSATIKELLMSAEYIMSGGNDRVILCERGVRGFDGYTRFTLDLSAVPVLHELTHLPVIVDPSHATGASRLVPPMALAAAACGADGIMTEVHCEPFKALCDGAQALRPEEFCDLAAKLRAVRAAARG